MNGNKLLLDTNILIYLSKKELKLEDFAGENDTLYISVISYMEAKGYAIILASAIENNLKLVTRNTQDFKAAANTNILVNPFGNS